MRVLNLYAGVGGNRKLWTNCKVEAVEYSAEIADVYARLYPDDRVFTNDAHQFLRDNFWHYDFIWSSPPCPTHSKMAKATRHKSHQFPDMRLYEEILLLQAFFKGKWVVENVVPFYEPLIKPTAVVGRHCFWSNFPFIVEDVERPTDFINLANMEGKKKLQDWLGIHFEENLYYEGNHCPAQVLRNCVHPEIGLQIFQQAQGIEPQRDQAQLF